MSITAYDQVLEVLEGRGNRTPFTAYETLLPRATYERRLRERGMCVLRLQSTFETKYKNVTITTHGYYTEDGAYRIKTHYDTPVGSVYKTEQPLLGMFLPWIVEYLFKSPDDFKVLKYMVQNSVPVPDYGPAAAAIRDCGGDYLIRGQIGLEPLQKLISGDMMSAQDFCEQWYENRDEILVLYEAWREFNRKAYPIIAADPIKVVNYGGNVIGEITSPAVFREYYTPNYQEAAEALKGTGKLLGCHFDSDNTSLMGEIAATPLDYIEAFDVGTGPDMKTAAECFKDKAIWLHFPSKSMYLQPDRITQRTLEILKDAGDSRVIMGLTEDLPLGREQEILEAIMDGCEIFRRQ